MDLPIGNSSVFVRRNYVDSPIAKFLGGTGTYELLPKDMLGTLVVDIDVHSANWRTAMTALNNAGELTALSTHLTQLDLISRRFYYRKCAHFSLILMDQTLH